MDDRLTITGQSALQRTVNYILDTVDDAGTWGGTDFEDEKPAITTLTVRLLLEGGFSPSSEWDRVLPSGVQAVSLAASLSYLNSCVRANGQFGEDIWDAVKFAELIERCQLRDLISNYPRLRAYIIGYVDRADYRLKDHTWAGPGSTAAMIDFLDIASETSRANVLFDELIKQQFPDGSFHGHVDAVGGDVVHCIWHTAQVLMTALRRNPSEKQSQIQQIVTFICSTQDKEVGYWQTFSRYPVYFTAYAILALNKLADKSGNVTDTLNKATEWLCSQIAETGKIRDAGGTIMGALALTSLCGKSLESKVTVAEVRRFARAEHLNTQLTTKLGEVDKELGECKAELDQYKRKFLKADIV